jgi:cytoskeleton protein RodZ
MATGASALPQQTVPVISALAQPAETDPAFDSAAGDATSVSEAAAITSPTADSLPDNTLPTADVTSAATAISATGEVIQSGASNSNVLLQTTVTDDGLTIIPSADGSRQVSMFRAGSDELLLRFVGDSWVEVDDGANVRLYSDMLNTGDTLTIQGTAPFQVLLGNAANVEVNFNDMAVNIASSIRADNTARVQLANPDNEASVSGTGVAQ